MWLTIVILLSLIIVALLSVICFIQSGRADYKKKKKISVQKFAALVCKEKKIGLTQVMEILSVTRKLIRQRTGEDIYQLMRGEK